MSALSEELSTLPEELTTAWKYREGPAVLCTVNSENTPNAIYVSYIDLYDSEHFYFVNHFMNKTRQNIESGSKGTLLFYAGDEGSFQIKGHFKNLEPGKNYQAIINKMPKGLPSKEVILLAASEVYTGSKRLA